MIIRLFAALCCFTVAACAAKPRIECVRPDPDTGTSAAVVVDPVALAHTTQVFPLDRRGNVVRGDVTAQALAALEQLEAALRSAGSGRKQVIKLNVYMTRDELRPAVEKVLASRWKGDLKPAVTFVSGKLALPEAMVAFDAVGISSRDVSGVERFHTRAIRSGFGEAHAAILPPRGAVYVAGLADKGPLDEATTKTLEKLTNTLAHVKLGRRDIVQLKAFLLPMSDLALVQEAIKKFFGDVPVPPTVFVEWLSGSVPIEIELIAAGPAELRSDEAVSYLTPSGITASPVFSRIAQVNYGRRIYISGLYGVSEPENDVKEIFSALQEILQQTGGDLKHLAKATYYWSDPKANGRLDAFRPTVYDPKRPPAASKARVPAVGQAGRGITIDMIGVVPGRR